MYLVVSNKEVCVNAMGVSAGENWNWQVDVSAELQNVEVLNEKTEMLKFFLKSGLEGV